MRLPSRAASSRRKRTPGSTSNSRELADQPGERIAPAMRIASRREGVGNRELRFGRQPSVRFGFVRERGREKAVGPVFGVAAGVGEDDRDARVADLETCELVGEPIAVDVLKLEQGAVAGLDNDCGEREFGEPLELEGEAAVGERTREVLETL